MQDGSVVRVLSVAVSGAHLHCTGVNMADRNPLCRKIKSAPSNLKTDVWKDFGFYSVDDGRELDKSNVIM